MASGLSTTDAIQRELFGGLVTAVKLETTNKSQLLVAAMEAIDTGIDVANLDPDLPPRMLGIKVNPYK